MGLVRGKPFSGGRGRAFLVCGPLCKGLPQRSSAFSVSLLAGIVLAIGLAACQSVAAARTYGDFSDVEFIRCYDGDTCTFIIPGLHPLLGERISVRIRGIDTPEIKGKCGSERVLAGAARNAVDRMLRQASRIDLMGVGRGKYFRILASVVADGQDISIILIENGLAVGYGGGRKKGWCE